MPLGHEQLHVYRVAIESVGPYRTKSVDPDPDPGLDTDDQR